MCTYFKITNNINICIKCLCYIIYFNKIYKYIILIDVLTNGKTAGESIYDCFSKLGFQTRSVHHLQVVVIIYMSASNALY